MNKRSPYPTDAELEILKVLWRKGPLTVRHAWEEMGGHGAYTTVLKLLQIMLEKGYVTRDISAQTHIYAAAFSEAENQERMVGGLMERAFGGSLSQLVMRALSSRPASARELAQVEELLKQARADAAAATSGTEADFPKPDANSVEPKQEGGE